MHILCYCYDIKFWFARKWVLKKRRERYQILTRSLLGAILGRDAAELLIRKPAASSEPRQEHQQNVRLESGDKERATVCGQQQSLGGVLLSPLQWTCQRFTMAYAPMLTSSQLNFVSWCSRALFLSNAEKTESQSQRTLKEAKISALSVSTPL